MSSFTVTAGSMDGLYIIEKHPRGDERGQLMRMFCADELRPLGWSGAVAQANTTRTSQAGTLRGLHFQHPPHAETKIVTCTRGEVLDVAVDLRANSPTFLQWTSVLLTGENNISFYIPEGFAHGFQSLTPDVEMLYFHSAAYDPQFEGGLNALDQELGITWPLEVSLMSDRDKSLPNVGNFSGLNL